MWRKTGTLVIIFSVSTALVTVFISSPFNKQMLCYAYCSNELCESELFYLTTTTNHNNNHHLRASVMMNWYQRYYMVPSVSEG